MTQITFPNQKMVTIHKNKYIKDFLQVGKDEWMNAFADLSPNTFGVYLYLCGNMDGYRLALSSAALQNALCFSDSSYRRAVKELKDKGYLVQKGSSGNVLDFYTIPQEQPDDTAVNNERAAAPAACGPYEKPSCKASSVLFSHSYNPNDFGWEEN